ncbi:MAG TPA: GNAT family protein [Telluria sp.]|nr:GNAT family protein [Telluria sp.]
MQITSLESATGVSIIPVTVHHAADLASLVRRNDEHLRAYLPAVAKLSTAEATTSHLLAAEERSAKGEIFEWHLFESGTLCGSVRIKDIDQADRKAKIGYFIDSQFAGRGIVTSAVSAVLAYCFGPLRLNRIELRCAAGNERSQRVAERLGFVHEGLLRQEEYLNGVFIDQHVYGLLSTDFQADGRL